MTNYSEYNEGLRRRGDLTVWISDDAHGLWSAPRRTTRGGQRTYSDPAIEICLTLGVVYKQPLRQIQGFMRSIAALLGVDIAVPDFSTLSRRGNGLTLSAKLRPSSHAPVDLVVDNTGLKIFGVGEWIEQKHKTKRKRRSWRKLHLGLGLDLVSGEIVCADLTKDDVGDMMAVPGLLDQVDSPVGLFLADGAYDGDRRRTLVRADLEALRARLHADRQQSAGRRIAVRNCHSNQWRSNGSPFGTESLTHHVNILEMNGESYRLGQSRARKAEAGTLSPVAGLALRAKAPRHAPAMWQARAP